MIVNMRISTQDHGKKWKCRHKKEKKKDFVRVAQKHANFMIKKCDFGKESWKNRKCHHKIAKRRGFVMGSGKKIVKDSQILSNGWENVKFGKGSRKKQICHKIIEKTWISSKKLRKKRKVCQRIVEIGWQKKRIIMNQFKL